MKNRLLGLLDYVGLVRRGGTKGWCCSVSLFSFIIRFSWWHSLRKTY